ncbi:hypothetical protein C2E23DRAFT_610198 [Lenzites betulinus]|nr:hypothetical protein C2E23DRAFT_610198 [Lenzites betulinus]
MSPLIRHAWAGDPSCLVAQIRRLEHERVRRNGWRMLNAAGTHKRASGGLTSAACFRPGPKYRVRARGDDGGQANSGTRSAIAASEFRRTGCWNGAPSGLMHTQVPPYRLVGRSEADFALNPPCTRASRRCLGHRRKRQAGRARLLARGGVAVSRRLSRIFFPPGGNVSSRGERALAPLVRCVHEYVSLQREQQRGAVTHRE